MLTTTEILLEPQEVELEKESKKSMESFLNSNWDNQNMGTNLMLDEYIIGNANGNDGGEGGDGGNNGNNGNNGNFDDVQNILNVHN